MKKNDSGDFCVLYVEIEDERADLFSAISEQKKPVVIMLMEQGQVFQRPEDFTSLKLLKRRFDLSIVFVIPAGGQFAQLAARNGFPVYLSMDALANALSFGQLTRSRPLRSTEPIQPQKSSDTQGLPLSYGNELDLAERPPSHNGISQNGFQNIPVARNPVSEPGLTPSRGYRRASAQRQTGDFTDRETLEMNITPEDELDSEPETISRQNSEPISRRRRTSRELVRRNSMPLRPRTSKPLEPGRVLAPAGPPSLTLRGGFQQVPRISPILIILAIAVVIGGVGAFLVLPGWLPANPSAAPASNVAGYMVFTGSGYVSESSTQGIGDQIAIEFRDISSPVANHSYYAWLLADADVDDANALLLGKLEIVNGTARLDYDGDAQHTSLLMKMSRFLVTEESASITPIAPSPDQSTWRYYAEFDDVPVPSSNGKQYSYLDHLRHILVSDPTLDSLELPGGLNNWFYRNIGKVLEWTGSVRESWEQTHDVGFLRRQTTRSLQYLSSTTFAPRDLPPDTPLLVNERLARIGLIQVDGPNQQPPSYMSHIVHHLNGLLSADGSTTEMRQKIAPLIAALANIDHWLSNVRTNAIELVNMSDEELLNEPETLDLINAMIDNANHAYTGEMDPITNEMREGATWVNRQMQTLATLNIMPYDVNDVQTPSPASSSEEPAGDSPVGVKHEEIV